MAKISSFLFKMYYLVFEKNLLDLGYCTCGVTKGYFYAKKQIAVCPGGKKNNDVIFEKLGSTRYLPIIARAILMQKSLCFDNFARNVTSSMK